MRVTIVGPAYPLRGGIAHHVYWLRQELTARGHSVQVISFRKLYPDLLFPGTTEIDTSRLRLDAGAEAILAPLDPASWAKAFQAIRGFSPDLVVFQWWQPFFGLLAGTLARRLRKAGIDCLMECHNIFPHEATPLDRVLLKYAFRPVEHFITHSNEDRRDLLSLVHRKTVSVSSLPALDEFASPNLPDRSGRTILFFGKVRKYKGLPVLLEAMPKVLSRIDCELVIAGEFYDSLEKHREIIRRLGIEQRVRIEDRYVPNEEVPALFDRADLLVLPYVSATQSGVAQIAFSNALPVIASETGGLGEIVIENFNGLLFRPGDSGALADRIVSYFSKNLGPVFAKNILGLSQSKTKCKVVEIIEETAGRCSTGERVATQSS